MQFADGGLELHVNGLVCLDEAKPLIGLLQLALPLINA